MRTHDTGGPIVLGIGLLFLLTGAALLMQELDVLTLRWSYLLPIIVVTAGLAILISGVLLAHRTTSGGTR